MLALRVRPPSARTLALPWCHENEPTRRVGQGFWARSFECLLVIQRYITNNNIHYNIFNNTYRQQHTKQGTPHSSVRFSPFTLFHISITGRSYSCILLRATSLAGQRRALEGRQVSGSVAWSSSNLLLRRTRLLHLTTLSLPLSSFLSDTLAIFTLLIHCCSGLCDSDRCPECARLLFECLSACVPISPTTTITTTCRRARLTWTRRCRRRAA
jgi:hypothetical protein